MDQPPPPPGWYADPSGSGGQRWWDGSTWGDAQPPPPVDAAPARNYWPIYAAAALAITVLIVAGVVTESPGRDDQTATEQRTSTTSRTTPTTTEGKLAALAGDGLTDAAARPYASALNAAEPVCTEGRSGIGDVVYAGQQAAERNGVETTTLELLRAIPGSVPVEMRPMGCAQIVAGLVALMAP
jgi:hypothetical protein